MNINIQSKDRNLIVALCGDIDHHSVEKIKATIEKEFSQNNSKNLILDLSDIQFMDSSGIGMIIGRYKTLSQQGGEVLLVNVSTNAKRIIEVSGLNKIIKCYDNVELALSNLQ